MPVIVEGTGFQSWARRELRAGVCGGETWINLSGRPSITLHAGGKEPSESQKGIWSSPVVDLQNTPLLPGSEINPSCALRTPGNSYVIVKVVILAEDGEWYEYILGEVGDAYPRTSVLGQNDEWASVAIDTLVAKSTIRAYQLQVELVADGDARPEVFRVSADAVGVSKPQKVERTPREVAKIIEGISQITQMVSDEKFTGFGAGTKARILGGGWAWCSAACMAMLFLFWGVAPTEEEIREAAKKSGFRMGNLTEGLVHWVARLLYDKAYDGTGNWLMNVAAAGQRGLDGWLRKFPSIGELGKLIDEGIPFVASISWKSGQWPGASIPKSKGHLVLVCGETADGRVVFIDPRRTEPSEMLQYMDSALFDALWEPSGRLAYVIKRAA